MARLTLSDTGTPTVGVQEIPSLGVFLLDAADDHDVRFDLAVRMERRFAVAPPFDRSNVFVDAELCHRNSSEGPILRGRLFQPISRNFLGSVLGRIPTH
jgi:hypothetical protein